MKKRRSALLACVAVGLALLLSCREPRTSANDHPLGFAKLHLRDVVADGRRRVPQEAGPLTYRLDLPDYSVFVTPVVIRRSSVYLIFEAPTIHPIFIKSVSLTRIEEGRQRSARIDSWLDYLELPLEKHGWPATPTLQVYAWFRPGSTGTSYSGEFTLVRRDPETLRALSSHRIEFRGLEGRERYGVPDWRIDLWHRWRVKIRNSTVLSQVF